MSTPAWNAVVVGSPFAAGNINQFLGTHDVNAYIYQGVSTLDGVSSGTGTVYTNSGSAAQYIDQPFTTAVGQTTLTRIDIYVGANVGDGADTTIGIYADSGGAPTGTALASYVLPKEFDLNGWVSMPFGLTGLSASTLYHILIEGTTDTSNYSGFADGTTINAAAQTSPTGIGGTWTTLGKELAYNICAGTNGLLRNTIEDGGARWVGLDYTAEKLTTIREYNGTFRSVRTLTYTGGILTSVA
jgi:hypothetical protein